MTLPRKFEKFVFFGTFFLKKKIIFEKEKVAHNKKLMAHKSNAMKTSDIDENFILFPKIN